LPWEEIILLKYTPTQDGKNATFTSQRLAGRVPSAMPKVYPEVNIHHLLSRISSSPNGLYPVLGKKIPPSTDIEFKYSEENSHILQKYYSCNGRKLLLGHILICELHRTCALEDLSEFIRNIYEEAIKFQGNLMAVDPIIVAESYDDSVKFFIDQYNTYETRAGRQAISAYMLSN
jgi:hypothetical protein